MPFKPGQAGAASAAKIASDAHPKRAAASAASVAMSPQKRIRRQRVSVRKATTEPARAEAAFDRKHPRQDELTKKEKTRLTKAALPNKKIRQRCVIVVEKGMQLER